MSLVKHTLWIISNKISNEKKYDSIALIFQIFSILIISKLI